jgi:hypothetical protein
MTRPFVVGAISKCLTFFICRDDEHVNKDDAAPHTVKVMVEKMTKKRRRTYDVEIIRTRWR